MIPVDAAEPEPARRPVEPWTLLADRPGLSGRWLRVTTATYRLPRGELVEWDVVHEADAVAVLALTPDGQVVLARQYRPGPGAVLDEMPGGLLDLGESAAAAAGRELLEETGYAGQVEVVGWAWQDGRSTRRMWTAVATGCVVAAEPAPGPAEDIEVLVVPVADFVGRVRSGALTDAARAYRALDHLGLLGGH